MTSPKDKPAAAAIKKLLSHNPDGQRDLPVGHALGAVLRDRLHPPKARQHRSVPQADRPASWAHVDQPQSGRHDGLSAVAGTPNR